MQSYTEWPHPDEKSPRHDLWNEAHPVGQRKGGAAEQEGVHPSEHHLSSSQRHALFDPGAEEPEQVAAHSELSTCLGHTWEPGAGPSTERAGWVMGHERALAPVLQQQTFWTEFEAIGWQGSSANACREWQDKRDYTWTPDGVGHDGMGYGISHHGKNNGADDFWNLRLLEPGKPMDIPIRFDFFTESDSVTAMRSDEVAAFRKNRLIKTSDSCPRPVVKFADAGFPVEITDEIVAAGFAEPTPIQSQGWPVALRGLDLVGIASTGSGKTLAFMLPALVHALDQPAPSPPGQPGEGPIVLVLAPTRELACQIRDECTRYMRGSKLNCVCIYGGAPRHEQIHDIQELCPQAFIATPGRLIDLLECKITTLARVTYLVLDEADRMLEMGFKQELDEILSQIRTERQTIMTSATWPVDMAGFAKTHLRADHQEIHIGRTGTASRNIEQRVIACSADAKLAMLEKVLHEVVGPDRKVIVFVRTKRGTEDVAGAMRRAGFDAETMHADRSQQERDAVIYKFKRSSTMLLFATDVAQRGLDVKGVSHVINFDLPNRLDDYIHRVGRTGRAGVSGSAVSFCCSGDSILPSLVKLFDESKLPVPTEVRALSAACFGNGYADRSPRAKEDYSSANLADLKRELSGVQVRANCQVGENSSSSGHSAADSSRMFVGNLPISPRPLDDVQKFSFEKELRKLLAFCGPIKAIGFETRSLNAAEYFAGTAWIDFEKAADAAYATRMYDGYTMTTGSPLGKRLECSLVRKVPEQQAPQRYLRNERADADPSETGPPLQEYLHVGMDMSNSQHHTLTEPTAELEQVLQCSSAPATKHHASVSQSATPDNASETMQDCARMKAWWDELTADEKNAAECLGWSKLTWELGAGPTTGVAGWATMSDPEKLAAATLGYNQEVWNEEGGKN